ncbi:MAG: gliding motility-associated C-terminal domain-containing protein [Bacteroidales bacterium]|nr:gliding motility-associated C-terminal domain-containing protein [Bacteroidales bacterium]
MYNNKTINKMLEKAAMMVFVLFAWIGSGYGQMRTDTNVYVTLCQGAPSYTFPSVDFFQGRTFNASGLYTDTLRGGAVGGADSIMRLYLTIIENPEVTILSDPAGPNYCAGIPVTLTAASNFSNDVLLQEDFDCLAEVCDTCDDQCNAYYETYNGLGCNGLAPGGTNYELSQSNYATILPNFPTRVNAYPAGDAIKIGKIAKIGSITSTPLDLSQPFGVTIRAKGWGTYPGKIIVSVDGGHEQAFVTTNDEWPGTYRDTTLYFAAATVSSTITIRTDTIIMGTGATDITGYRALIDEIRISRMCHYQWSTPNNDATSAITFTPTQDSTYSVTVTGDNGCRGSTSHPIHIVHSTGTVDEVTTVGSYIWHGRVYTSPGEYYYANVGANGCESVDTLRLTLEEVDLCNSWQIVTSTNDLQVGDRIIIAACDDDLALGEQNGNFRDTVPIIKSADHSTIESIGNATILTVVQTSPNYLLLAENGYLFYPGSNNYLNEGEITSNSYWDITFNGGTAYIRNISYPNFSIQYNSSAPRFSCYSSVQKKISIYKLGIAHSDISITNCGPITFSGQTYSSTGDYEIVLDNASTDGCDSIVHLHLTILPIPTLSVSPEKDTVCSGESITLNATSDCMAGEFAYTEGFAALTTGNSTSTSDSRIPVPPIFYQTSQLFANGNAAYQAGGAVKLASRDSIGYLTTEPLDLSTDFTIKIWAKKWNAGEGEFSVTVDNTLLWSRMPDSETNFVEHTHNFAAATTSSIITIAAENKRRVFIDSVAIVGSSECAYVWRRGADTLSQVNSVVVTPESSGWYHASVTDQNGCSSEDSVEIIVPRGISDTATACNWYEWLGDTYTESGTYYHPYTDANGCNQVDTLHLTVNRPFAVDTFATACGSFTWLGTEYTATPDVAPTFTTTAANGCDSVVALHLTVNRPFAVDTFATACGSFTWHGNEYTETPDVAPTFTTTAANGCDSVVTLHLTVNRPSAVDTFATACGSFIWHGTEYTETPAVDPTFTTTAANGCDSVVTLHLTVNRPFAVDTFATVCGSFIWHGNEYTETPTVDPTFTTTAANECDSVVTLHLTVFPKTPSYEETTTCGSYEWFGNTYTESGTYYHPYTDANGCSQADTLRLTVNPLPNVTISGNLYIHQFESTTLTAGGAASYVWSDNETSPTVTVSPTVSTLYSVTGTDENDCRNSAQVVVTVGDCIPAQGVDEQTACDSFTWVDGITYYQSNTSATHIIPNGAINGCDSVVTLHLTVNRPFAVDTFATACGSFTWHGTEYTETPTVDPTFTTTAANGCDSVVTLHLTVNKPFAVDTFATVCGSFIWHGNEYTATPDAAPTFTTTAANGCDSVVTLHLTVFPKTPSYEETTTCDSYEWFGNTYTESGTYYHPYTDANGCSQVDTLHLTVSPSTNELLTVTECDSYYWNGHTYYNSGIYTYTHFNEYGCEQNDTLHLIITPCEEILTMPNAFSPNGDGLNDYFSLPKPYVDQINGKSFRIAIYNRWGQIVFSSSDKHFKWYGDYHGEIYHNNTYSYFIEYLDSMGEQHQLKGSIVVL